MSGINKHSFLSQVLGMILGVTFSGVVYAGQVTNPTFAGNETLTAAHMNNIKTAVNANDTLSGACTVGAGDATDGMARVGPVCVDKYAARASFAGCALNGAGAGCATAIATSDPADGAIASGMSPAQAARACANAGKRLLTPGEWLAAFVSGALSDVVTAPADATQDRMEFVDALLTIRSTNTVTDPSGPGAAIAAQGSYMGPRFDASNKVQMLSNIAYDETGGVTFIRFRCAR